MAAATALGLALAATHRVIDRVHDHAAHRRPDTAPTAAPGFAGRFVHVLGIADLADCCVAVFVNLADFTGRQFHQRVTSFAVVDDDQLASTAGDLTAATGDQFHVMNRGTERDGAQR